LNEVVSLDLIDKALSSVASRIRQLNMKAGNEEAMAGQKEKELKSFPDLEKLEEGLTALEKKEQMLKRKQGRLVGIREVLNELDSRQKDLVELEWVIGAERKLEAVVSEWTELQKIDTRKILIIRNLSSIERERKKLKKAEQEIISLEKALPKACPTCGRPFSGNSSDECGRTRSTGCDSGGRRNSGG